MSPPEQNAIAERPQTTSHRRDVNEYDENGITFPERQRSHFSRLVREKWECPQEGHDVCVPTEDGQHFQLAEENIEHWVDALCVGSASTANPPHEIFNNIRGGVVFNRSNGELTVRAVSIAPSRKRPGPHHQPNWDTARSIDSTVATRSSGNSFFSWDASTTESATSGSTFVPGPGYFGGKAIKWFGEKGLDGVGYALLVRRSKMHRSCLEKWERERPALDADVRAKVFEMLGDAMEMSRQGNSTNVNNKGYLVGRAVHHWLHTSYEDIPEAPETLVWFIKVQLSLIPILLTRISRADPLAGDLAHRTLHTLTRVPLAHQDTETVGRVIWHVSRELAYAKCSFQHSWLGVWLLRIVEMSLRLRKLTHAEIKAIKELAVRREEQPTDYAGKGDNLWRPWEVALFAQCASQDSWFKAFVVGAHGLPNLIAALDTMLADQVRVHDVHWENVALTLRALAFLSEHEWLAEAVDDPVIVRSLLRVFRRSIPERWFCIRFWAADTIRNMVAHRPQLARTLLREDAISAFETLKNPQLDRGLSINLSQPNRQRPPLLRSVPPVPAIPAAPPTPQSPLGSPSFQRANSPQHPPDLISASPTENRRFSLSSTASSNPPLTPSEATIDRRMFRFSMRRPSTNSTLPDLSQSPTQTNPRRPPSLIPTAAQGRLLEDYKVAATKRAEELSVYVRRWTEWTPDKQLMLEVPRLEALGAGVGWLSEWEGAGWTGEGEQ